MPDDRVTGGEGAVGHRPQGGQEEPSSYHPLPPPEPKAAPPATSSVVTRAVGGDRRALARLLSRVEQDDDLGRRLAAQIYPLSGTARRIGITGPPGAGKSSLIARLIGELRADGHRVGVITVDPTSPMTGGATLGDRIRLMEFHSDPDVFVRSMASRGHRGGLAATTTTLAHVLDAAGFDPILIETLGVGQDEVEVARLVHTAVVLQVPGLGDAVQTLKAGLLEVADILVVNKADQPGADRLARDLATMLALAAHDGPGNWTPPIVKTDATTGDGVSGLVQAIEQHYAHLASHEGLSARVADMAAAEMSHAIRREIEDRLRSGPAGEAWASEVLDVAARRSTPSEAVRRLIDPP